MAAEHLQARSQMSRRPRAQQRRGRWPRPAHRRPVGDIAHRVDGLVRWTRGDQYMPPFSGPLVSAASIAQRFQAVRPSGRGRIRRRPYRLHSGPRVNAVVLKTARLRCVAGCSHIRTFIAGAINTGVSVANKSVEARSSACPPAILAIRSAVRAPLRSDRPSATARYGPSRPRRSDRKGRNRVFPRPRAETDNGVTNSDPARVRTGVTLTCVLSGAGSDPALEGRDAAANDQ